MKKFERVLVLRWFRRKPKPSRLALKLLAVHMAQASTLSALR